MDTNFGSSIREPNDPAALTVLRAHGGHRLAKRFYVGSDGQVARADFGNAVEYEANYIVLSGIDDLHQLLGYMEPAYEFCVIRGAQTPECNPASTRRCKASFAEVPRYWVVIDIDGADLVPGLRVCSDPKAAAHSLVGALLKFVPELAGGTVVVQWSSSAATAELAEHDECWLSIAKPGLSAHVWCWLRKPLGETELKRWMQGVNHRVGFRLLDEATCRTVQPIYTSAPLFSSALADPLAGRRTLLLRGAHDEVELNVPAAPLIATAASLLPRTGETCDRGDGEIGYGGMGRVVDGRDTHLSRIAYRLVREAAEAGLDPDAEQAAIIEGVWAEFRRTADLARPKRSGWPYSCQDAADKVRQKLASLRAGTLPASTSSHRSVAGSLALLKALRGRR
jgi:hypothetical protein